MAYAQSSSPRTAVVSPTDITVVERVKIPCSCMIKVAYINLWVDNTEYKMSVESVCNRNVLHVS
jgi:hypothetical protein